MKHYIYAFTLAALLSACSSTEKDPLKGQFLSGCIQSGSSKEVCNCAYDQITGQHTKQEIFKMFTDMKHVEKLKKTIADAQKACLL